MEMTYPLSIKLVQVSPGICIWYAYKGRVDLEISLEALDSFKFLTRPETGDFTSMQASVEAWHVEATVTRFAIRLI